MKRFLPFIAIIAFLFLLGGCSTTNLTKIVAELKQDPATVEFSVVAPGWAVQFKRAWPTNIVRVPASTLQVNPAYQLPPVPPFNDPLR